MQRSTVVKKKIPDQPTDYMIGLCQQFYVVSLILVPDL